MRRLTLMAALGAALALAGCTLKTPEGAACDLIGGMDQCPEGQRCGADGKCSVAAMGCAKIECSVTTCSGNSLEWCVTAGPCSTLVEDACSTLSQTCDAANETCQCVDAQGCPGFGTMCTDDRTATISCGEEKGCPYRTGNGTPHVCDPGEDCVDAFPNARCDCPAYGDAEDQRCAENTPDKCTGEKLLKCAPRVTNSRCYTWQAEDCSSSGLLCSPGAVGAAGACLCPSHQPGVRTLIADPGAVTHFGTEPNGTAPLACRFRTLQAALEKGQDGDTVKVAGAGATVTIPGPPAVVRRGITLVGDATLPPVPANAVFVVEGPGTTGLTVEAGGSVSGLTVRKGAGAAATVGVAVTGASPVPGPSLQAIVVDAQGAGGAFDTGVLVGGTGAVSIQGLTVLDAKANGLQVLRTSPSDAVAVADLLAKRNSVGVKVEVGDLSLSAASIELSAQQGILAVGGAAAVGLDITGSTIKFNQRGGVRAGNLSRFHLSGSKLCRNGGPLEDVPGLAFQRTFGGLLLIGEAPAGAAPGGNSIKDSTFTDNDGDQVAVLNSRAGSGVLTTWNLAPGACGPTTSNVFNGYNSSLDLVSGLPLETGLFASDAGANATRSAWQVAPPNPNRDFLQVAGGEVTSGAEGGALNYCTLLQVQADTTCPDVLPLP